MSTSTAIREIRSNLVPYQYDSQVFGNSDLIIGSPVVFLSAFSVNKANSTLWIHFFDAVTLPPNGTVPLWIPVPITQNTVASIDLSHIRQFTSGLLGIPVKTGLVWAASTTAGTLTVDATSSIWMTARYGE